MTHSSSSDRLCCHTSCDRLWLGCGGCVVTHLAAPASCLLLVFYISCSPACSALLCPMNCCSPTGVRLVASLLFCVAELPVHLSHIGRRLHGRQLLCAHGAVWAPNVHSGPIVAHMAPRRRTVHVDRRRRWLPWRHGRWRTLWHESQLPRRATADGTHVPIP